jgi:hypothetical protein
MALNEVPPDRIANTKRGLKVDLISYGPTPQIRDLQSPRHDVKLQAYPRLMGNRLCGNRQATSIHRD